MPKGSVELTNARREEIVDACAELYRTRPFREITIKEIGEKTSVTRTSIYNYFQTKEEIFLALLQREYQAWGDELDALPPGPMSTGQLADALARTLERRTCMLKLMAMNLYDIETNSRLENLAAFKRVYARSMQAVCRCLERWRPGLPEEEQQRFLYAFFPFLFGVYPYTTVTEKQKQAMVLAHVEAPRLSVYELICGFVRRLLQGMPG